MAKGGSKPGERRGGRQKGTPNKKPEAIVRRVLAPALKRFESRVERILEEYGHIAGLDIRDAFDSEGNLKAIKDWPEQLGRAVAGIEFEEVFDWNDTGENRERIHSGRIHKIRLVNKLGALDSIAKHLGMFVERHEHTGKGGGSINVSVRLAGTNNDK